ncbi:MAG TPA: class IV adenylate cyclase [Candidatus Acidoferrales bacterium]|nr:class IV adenylate cyclase [Candidatus Acidoferrales bacterium]
MPRHSRTGREIEIKLRVAHLAALVRDLRRLGATEHGRVLERNTLYDTPSAGFRSRRRLLRLRIETPAPSKFATGGARCAILTSKAPIPESARSRYKEKLEREVAVESPRRWPSALRAIGLRPSFRYEKYRSTFRLAGLHLDLDETPVGVFLELEGAPRSIDRVARSLGFVPREYINGTYWDLYAADCRRRGRKPANMLFST